MSLWTVLLGMGLGTVHGADSPSTNVWDLQSDTWVATDDLGRKVLTSAETGLPRPDKSIGLFYFLWHGEHIQGGPYDISRILAQDPDAMQKKDSPLWGPMHVPHHWGESIFGHYRTDDEFVLRKHAQMLADAGVDAIFFDVSNQFTYRKYYMPLLKVFAEFKAQGGRPPQVAFLCPFWDPPRVVAELYKDLYEPGLYSDLWYRWEGKPLILADPALLLPARRFSKQNTADRLEPGHTLGQQFTTDAAFESVGGRFPTYNTAQSALTLTLYRDNPKGERLASQRFTNVSDNAWVALRMPQTLPAGTYYLEAAEPSGPIGWWSHTEDVQAGARAYADGQPGSGDRTLLVGPADASVARYLEFFTFRKPQPDYFQGPTQPNMWSWLEVYPQHVFTNAAGLKEQMCVGVGQNAVDGRLGCMSEKGAHGRSFHDGATDARPNAVRQGYNVIEQWERALKEDPKTIFITGWNEWIAGRFDEFNGVRQPVMFVDQFDQEHSRDIEPMRGGHGDDYYYQMVSYIRRYKGARPLPAVTSQRIALDGRFDDWKNVGPEFRDTVGDPARRNHPSWNASLVYKNDTGRNDLVAAKVSRDGKRVHFYARTASPITAPDDKAWMLLFIDADANPATGWLGYDFVVNRKGSDDRHATLEACVGREYRWEKRAQIDLRREGCELELAIPQAALGLKKGPATLDFKWADHIRQTGEAADFTLHGDVAPNDRFNYRAVFK